MKAAALAIAVALIGALVGASPAGAQGAERGDADRANRRVVVRFLTTNDYPPFNYQDEDGVLTGFNVDLARALCLEMNVACDFTVRAWEELLPALARRQADAVIAGHIVSSLALATVDFTDRYFHTPGRFAGRRDSRQLEITPEGLEGRRIGVAKATTHEAFLQAFFHDSAIVRFDSVELARDALVEGKVELIFDDGVSLALWLNGTLSKECCEFKGGPFLEPKFFGDGVAIAVGKEDRQLRGELNQALKRVRASGRFEELVLRYFPYRVY